MKDLSAKKLVIIKKIIGLCGSILCLLLMLTKLIRYTSNSSLISGGNVVWNDTTSLFSFLFSGETIVLDSKVSILREIFAFSHIIFWISFILCLISLILLSVSIFLKKSIISKIGSSILIVGTFILIFTSFDKYKSNNTIKYLDVFTWFYALTILISLISLFSTWTIEDKKQKQ